ncbi:MAG: HEAT repeat domain-containing protein [Candidatus Woesearchaeota archaeon]
MPVLEKIVRTGLISTDSNDQLHKEMLAFDEFLIAQEFTDAINNDEISIEDAYNHYWSYKEDKELWGLEDLAECRAILPDWSPILTYMVSELNEDKAAELAELVSNSYLSADKILTDEDYNPFFDNGLLALRLINVKELDNHPSKEGLYKAFSATGNQYKFSDYFDSRDFYPFLIETASSDAPARENAIRILARRRATEIDDILVPALEIDSKSNWTVVAAIGEMGDEKLINNAFSYFMDKIKEFGTSKKGYDIINTDTGELFNTTDYNPDELLSQLVGRYNYSERTIVNPELLLYIDSLGHLGGQKSLDFLLNLFDLSRDYFARAAEKSNYESFAELQSLKKEDIGDLRVQITKSIIKIGSDKGKEVLSKEFKGDNEELIDNIITAIWAEEDFLPCLEEYIRADRTHVKTAMERVVRINKEKAIPLIMEYLGDIYNQNRCAIAHSLWEIAYHHEIKHTPAIPLLKDLMEDRVLEYHIRRRKVSREFLFETRNVYDTLVKLEANSAIPILLEANPILDSLSGGMTLHGVSYLDGSKHIPFLTKQLENPNHNIRAMALELLAKVESPPYDKIRKIAVSSSSWYIKGTAVNILGRNPTKENLDVLYSILENIPDNIPKDYTWDAVSYLAKEDYERFKPLMFKLASHENYIVRWGVVKACKLLYQDQDVKELLKKIISEDKKSEVVLAASRVIQESKDENTGKYLQNVYKTNQEHPGEDSSSVKSIIMDILKDSNDVSEEELLTLFKQETDPYNKEDISKTLKNVVTEKSLPYLFDFLEEEEKTNRSTTSAIMACILPPVSRDWLLKNNINLNQYSDYHAKEIHEKIRPRGYKCPQ